MKYMISVKREGVILKPTQLEFENLSVFNPGIYQDGQYVHIFYRAIDKDHISCVGYAKAKGPGEIVERWKKPYLEGKYKYESCGIEDPRIVKIEDTFYMTYVVHDGKNALGAYAFGQDLFNLKRGGLITPTMSYNRAGKLMEYTKLKDKYFFFKSYYKDMVARNVKLWNKDIFLFPEKINGKYVLGHRIAPDIQIAYFDKFSQLKNNNFWSDNLKNLADYVMLEGKYGFEARHIGGGCPPVKTKHGWLMIYHGVEPMNKGRIYHACASLHNLKDPTKLIARLPYPLFSPDTKWEVNDNHVHNVVFPTGTSIFKDKLFIYYGAGDSYISLASLKLEGLVKELLKYKQ
jgi:beta-1,2-mannobiose phosphorylase / 1,2-beta-oligomannan phosphorylase